VHNTGIMHLWFYLSGRRYLRWSAPVMPTWNLVPQLVHDTRKTEILKNILLTMTSYSPLPRIQINQGQTQLSCHILGWRNGTSILVDNLGVRREVSYKNR